MSGTAKIYALFNGIEAMDALGHPKTLSHGQMGYLPIDKARAAQNRGEVQMLVGLTTANLLPTKDEPVPTEPGEPPATRRGRRRNRYERRDMAARDL